jgi:hypothetical protein
MLLPIIPIGYLASNNLFVGHYVEFLLLNIISFLCFVAVLLSLKRLRRENIIIFIIFLIFLVGYFIKFYYLSVILISDFSDSEIRLFFGRLVTEAISVELLYKSFSTVVVAFVFFSVTSIGLLALNSRINIGAKNRKDTLRYSEYMAYRFIFAAIIIGVIVGYIRWYFQLGIIGVQANLPYKLAGIIHVVNTGVVPSLIGVALCYSVSCRNKKTWKIIIFFLAWGVVQFLFFPSKTSLVLPFLWIFLVGFAFDRSLINKKYIVLSIVIFAFVYPFLNIYRSVLYGEGGEFVLLALEAIISDGSSADKIEGSVVIYGIMLIISRVVGFGELMVLSDIRSSISDFGVLEYLTMRQSAGNVLTNEVGIAATGYASSFLGQAYYATGNNFLTGLWVSFWAIFAYLVSKFLLARNEPFYLAVWVMWIVSVTLWTVDELSVFKTVIFLVTCLLIYCIKIFTHAMKKLV